MATTSKTGGKQSFPWHRKSEGFSSGSHKIKIRKHHPSAYPHLSYSIETVHCDDAKCLADAIIKCIGKKQIKRHHLLLMTCLKGHDLYKISVVGFKLGRCRYCKEECYLSLDFSQSDIAKVFENFYRDFAHPSYALEGVPHSLVCRNCYYYPHKRTANRFKRKY